MSEEKSLKEQYPGVFSEKKCTCKFCRHSKWLRKIMEKMSKRDSKYIETLVNHYICVDDDLNYHEVVMAGDWPSSVEQLTIALAIAKKKRELNPQLTHNIPDTEAAVQRVIDKKLKELDEQDKLDDKNP